MIHLFPRSSFIFALMMTLSCIFALTSRSQADEQAQRVVFLGDSITAGYGLKKSEAYPAIIEKLAKADGHNIKVINAGLSGDTTSGGMRRIAVLARQPIDLLVIALGGNDGLRGIPATVSGNNLRTIVDIVRKKQPEVKILLTGMQMPENMGEAYTESFRKVFGEVAAEKKVATLPFLLEGVAADKELNLPDGIHPNAKGQAIVASHVYKAMLPLLKKSQ
ncbi:arylesterase [Verrucomicrobiaceae bacterium 5K15]|uniref:Arylesterase n=1 Tax=Oceaniferula flava TaxID=2800421 RepID=A0AAE2SAS0_9BACT|nr:arylesterase [Oceaniferula flavus]MBK1853987.1 arylesterase [Oceaniferula flavus]MBM1135293.1 arylesterase [Oceaniferula flavus]